MLIPKGFGGQGGDCCFVTTGVIVTLKMEVLIMTVLISICSPEESSSAALVHISTNEEQVFCKLTALDCLFKTKAPPDASWSTDDFKESVVPRKTILSTSFFEDGS